MSPFVQTKVMLHEEALNKLQSQKVIAPVTCEIDLTDGICNNKCRLNLLERFLESIGQVVEMVRDGYRR